MIETVPVAQPQRKRVTYISIHRAQCQNRSQFRRNVKGAPITSFPPAASLAGSSNFLCGRLEELKSDRKVLLIRFQVEVKTFTHQRLWQRSEKVSKNNKVAQIFAKLMVDMNLCVFVVKKKCIENGL